MPFLSPDHTPLAVRAPGVGGGLVIGRDEGDGIIRVLGEGSWTPAEVDAHFETLGRIVALTRAATGHVRVLVDLRSAGVQTPESASRVTAGTQATYRDGDRVAIVMATSFDKLQMRRAVNSLKHEMFLSPSTAMTWLCAYMSDKTVRQA